MLNCTETITLVRCDGQSYTMTEIIGVSWYDKSGGVMTDGGINPSNTLIIRIPANCFGDVLPQSKDQVVRGSISTTITTPADLAPYRPRTVMNVGDNRRGTLSHVVVTCR